MICDFDRIDALAEDALSAEEAAQVREHMENCQACRIYYLALSDAAGHEEPPAELKENIMHRVRSTPQVKPRGGARRSWRSIAAAAACAALVLGIGLAGSGFHGRTSAEDSSEMARNYESQTPTAAETADNGGSDLTSYLHEPTLTAHTVDDPILSAQIRNWLAAQNIPELYPDGPRETYDLTTDQVQALNRAVPEAELPEQPLQLELRGNT